MGRKLRRNTLEIYFDILTVIKDESTSGEVKPTHIQFRSNTSFDKLTKYLIEMRNKQLITQNPIKITEKGHSFLKDFEKINDFLKKISVDYL